MSNTGNVAGASAGEPEKKKESGCLGCFSLIVVVAIIGGIASSCGGSDSSGDHDAAPAATAIATTTDDTDFLADPAVAVKGWYSQGGDTQINNIIADLTAISGSASSADFPGLTTNCTSLQSDIADAQADGPIPDEATQGHWDSALNEFSKAADDCIRGAATYDSDLITQSGQELDAGGTELSLAASRVGELADN